FIGQRRNLGSPVVSERAVVTATSSASHPAGVRSVDWGERCPGSTFIPRFPLHPPGKTLDNLCIALENTGFLCPAVLDPKRKHESSKCYDLFAPTEKEKENILEKGHPKQNWHDCLLPYNQRFQLSEVWKGTWRIYQFNHADA
ncbi:hypothetical protein GW17_00008979, partial [Ensete ventricosum]